MFGCDNLSMSCQASAPRLAQHRTAIEPKNTSHITGFSSTLVYASETVNPFVVGSSPTPGADLELTDRWHPILCDHVVEDRVIPRFSTWLGLVEARTRPRLSMRSA